MMNKKDNHDLSCERVGKIFTEKEKKKVRDKKSNFKGNTYFKLRIFNEETKEAEALFVYPNLVSKAIFQTIKSNKYVDKRYLFYCEKKN